MRRLPLVTAMAALAALSSPAAQADYLFGRLVPGEGLQPNGLVMQPDVSDDGRVFVFASNATNWGVGSPTQQAIYAVNLAQGTILAASTTSTGTAFNGTSLSPSVSRDGRFIAMATFGTNLGLPVSTSGPHVVRKDVQTNALVLVSANAAGTPASGSAGGQARETAISADGNIVVFRSDAGNLVGGDAAGSDDIFAKDVATGAIAAISANANGTPVGNVLPLTPHAISADGRYVVWTSGAPNIVPGVPGGTIHVWLRDRVAQTTELMSRSTSNQPGGSQSDLPAISPSGRFVTFRSFAANFVGTRTDGVYLRDRLLNTTTAIPKPSFNGNVADGCRQSDVSDIGVVIMACTIPTVTGAQVFVHVPGVAGTPFLAPTAFGNGTSGDTVAINRDASAMAFDSIATNLVAGDTNGVSDVFVLVDEFLYERVFADSFE